MFNSRKQNPVVGQTRRFDREERLTETAVPQIKPVDMGMPRPWRMALTIQEMKLQMVFDMTESMLIGRTHPDSDTFPDIDLTPFNAEDSGVSRQHMNLMLHEDRVVVVDLDSVNGSYLNGERLEPHQMYPIRNGDELELGMMKVKVELLMNPLEAHD